MRGARRFTVMPARGPGFGACGLRGEKKKDVISPPPYPKASPSPLHDGNGEKRSAKENFSGQRPPLILCVAADAEEGRPVVRRPVCPVGAAQHLDLRAAERLDRGQPRLPVSVEAEHQVGCPI